MAPTGFDELFSVEYPRLVRALGATYGDAGDAVQEAFVQAYTRWHRIGRLDDPAGWIRRVAINRLLNTRRSQGRRDKAVTALSHQPANTTDLESQLDLRAAVQQLPPQQRMIITLHYGGGYPIQDIADAMNIAPGTVKYHLHAGREQLRGMLSEPDTTSSSELDHD